MLIAVHPADLVELGQLPARLFHMAPRSCRDDILRLGLLPGRAVNDEHAGLHEWESAGDADYVWMTDAQRCSSEHSDAWEIDTALAGPIGLGEPCDCPAPQTGTWFIASSIPIKALTLRS